MTVVWSVGKCSALTKTSFESEITLQLKYNYNRTLLSGGEEKNTTSSGELSAGPGPPASVSPPLSATPLLGCTSRAWGGR